MQIRIPMGGDVREPMIGVSADFYLSNGWNMAAREEQAGEFPHYRGFLLPAFV